MILKEHCAEGRIVERYIGEKPELLPEGYYAVEPGQEGDVVSAPQDMEVVFQKGYAQAFADIATILTHPEGLHLLVENMRHAHSLQP